LTGEPPIVIFSNALFTGDSTNGLRYAPPQAPNQPAQLPYVDTYTGIGELVSVYNLTRLFDAHHATFILKRSLLVTWDEAQLRNLIFIGSRAENPSLRVLPGTTDFTMMATPECDVKSIQRLFDMEVSCNEPVVPSAVAYRHRRDRQ
jgi:hypothetical protein